MMHNLIATRRRGGLAFVVVATALFVLPSAIQAQQAGPVKLFFWPEAKKPDPSQGKTTLQLRPNVTQEFFLFIYNGGKTELKNVAIELRAGGKAVATVNLASVPNDTQLVSFAPAPPPPPGGKPPAPAELAGEVEVVAVADKKEIAKAAVEVGRPSNYVKVSNAVFDREAHTLKMKVTASGDFTGKPACRVELDLRPERIPFLAPKQKAKGTYGGFLTGPNAVLELEAWDLQLLPSQAPGLAYLTVDGYPRAFTFRVTNTPEQKNEPKEETGPILRLQAAPVAAAGGPSKVGFEADYVNPGSKVELGLYRDDTFAPEKLDGKLLEFAGGRKERIFFSPSPNGGLLFTTEVGEWTTDLDTAKVFGGRLLRLRLIDAKGQAAAFTEAREAGELREGITQITAGIKLDGSPPEDVEFVEFPKELARGSALTLKAKGKDEDSDIAKVVFFAGKLPPDGVIPPTAVQAPGEKTKDKDVWAADLPVATDKAAMLEVGVQFTNGVGQTTTKVAVIKLVDAKAGSATIKGKVVENDREQDGLEVLLRDPKGEVKDKAKTDKDGKFVFKNVAPGTYQLVAIKSSSKTQGQAVVQVNAGDEKVLDDPIDLKRP
jgi:hypothetical protein